MLLKLLTYNIHKGFTVGNLRFSLHGMRDAIHSVNADVVLLQEVQGEHRFLKKTIPTWPDAESQAAFLAAGLYPHVVYSENAHYVAGHHGNAILSKYPFIMTENINVSKSKSASRSVLHAVIAHPTQNTPIHIICVHFGLFKAERKEQLDLLSNRIAAHVPKNEAVIIGGDFNDWLQEAALYLETSIAMKEVFKELHGDYARSFPVYQPLLTVDRLYCRDTRALHATVLYTAPWNNLSDHAALYAEFDIT